MDDPYYDRGATAFQGSQCQSQRERNNASIPVIDAAYISEVETRIEDPNYDRGATAFQGSQCQSQRERNNTSIPIIDAAYTNEVERGWKILITTEAPSHFKGARVISIRIAK